MHIQQKNIRIKGVLQHDEHITAYNAEHTWAVGSVDYLDWVNLGKQSQSNPF